MITSNPGPAPQTVDPFTIPSILDASPDSYVESSVVLTGSFSNLIVNGYGKLLRKNGTGVWSNSVSIDAGDTLNIRALSSANPNGVATHFITVGSRSATWTITNMLSHMFVLSDVTYPGNLGGLAGANAKCLTILQNGTFAGKAALTLDSGTVSAFLCDSVTCQNLRPNKRYFMSRISSSLKQYFSTNASGQGPLDLVNWNTNFGISTNYWTGRTSSGNVAWINSPGDGTCSNWTSSSSGISGTQGTCNSTNETRWSDSVSTPCNVSRRLICLIRSNTPDTFTLATVNGASTSTVYETSASISGLLSGGFTVTASDEIEVRKNGAGGWGTSVSVSNGDTLNVRMTSSATCGGSVTGKVYFRGESPITWTINNL